jgi:hypothetical protein
MSNTIHWGFANTPATFTTPKEKFEVTVSKLRTSLNIHPDHEIIIYSHAANQPVSNIDLSSDSDIDNDIVTPVSEDTETPKTRKKTI